MVSGQISPLHTNGSLLDAMDVTRDDDNAHQSVVRSKIVLVDCDGLQGRVVFSSTRLDANESGVPQMRKLNSPVFIPFIYTACHPQSYA